ncbi:DUF6370 family protein [uncultured Polaribacter sp.]|uniref:DUF6370 family protein n=1 Tax=uncultured Polaribacter sp. TaxID=174711 RepID=UPI002622EDDB|nr:DUF6370 family protein [uncultured Polaribacter sp.]
MKKIFLVFAIITLVSCTNNKEIKQVAEISCGQCQFELDNQNGCDLAIRINNKAYFVEGFNIDDFGDAHDKTTGFCEVIRKGKIVGKVEDNKFIASSIKLLD